MIFTFEATELRWQLPPTRITILIIVIELLVNTSFGTFSTNSFNILTGSGDTGHQSSARRGQLRRCRVYVGLASQRPCFLHRKRGQEKTAFLQRGGSYFLIYIFYLEWFRLNFHTFFTIFNDIGLNHFDNNFNNSFGTVIELLFQ